MTDALLVPRPFVRLLLLLLGAATSQLVWAFLDFRLVSVVAGLAIPACAFGLAAVWSMRDKADAWLDGGDLTSREFQSVRQVATQVRSRVTWKAFWVLGLTVVACVPTVSGQLAGVLWQWSIFLAGFAVAETSYAFLVAYAWEEELRHYRDVLIFEARQRIERAELMAAASVIPPNVESLQSGWTSVGGTLNAPGAQHKH